MLTEKEKKFLNFIYRRLKGKHIPFNDLQKILINNYGIDDDLAFEFAYLYDKNFEKSEGEEGMGDFSKVTEPERMSYEEYKQKMPWQVMAVMKVVNDDDPDAFDFDGDSVVTYMGDGEEYTIFNDETQIADAAESNDLSGMLCNESDPDENYIYMTDTDREIYSSEESDYRVEEMDDDEVIDHMDLEDTIEELESYEEKKEKLKDLEQELHDAETDEEIERIQSEIDEIEEKISNIGTTQSREEIIETAREELKSSIYDEIYDSLSDPFNYFINEMGIYADASELLENGPVQYDCDQYISDFLRDADIDSLANLAGYGNYDEVSVDIPDVGEKYVYVLWN